MGRARLSPYIRKINPPGFSNHNMSDNFKLRRAETTTKIKEVVGMAADHFWPHMTPEQAGDVIIEAIEKSPFKEEVYYYEHSGTKKPVCMAKVIYTPALFKDVDRGITASATPNPESFGVKNATSLTITFVTTKKEYRNLGLANKLITSIIDHVEKHLIKENLNKPGNDAFVDMVKGADGSIDTKLANYYLSKKYFWTLYSAVGKFYERFGFKPYPIEFYKIPTTILTSSQQEMIDQLLNKTEKSAETVGKKLRLLDSSKPQDKDLVSFILQNKELEILTELNKMTFHSELSGGRKSSSSMTNMTEILTMSKLASQVELTSISESKGQGAGPSGGRRKSSIQVQTFPKFALKPSVSTFEAINHFDNGVSNALEHITEENKKFNSIEGAIFSNDLQQKSHYILWASIQSRLFIIGVGELNFNMFGPMADPMGKGGSRSRRGSSFTGLNELGGYNFQDLDILFSTACMVAKKKPLEDKNAVYVAVNDLPSTIPAPMINDYFLNYLPKAFDNVNSEDSDAKPETKVELITDGSKLHVLPCLRKFGQSGSEIDIDWISNGMWSWS